jgi:hypothetical protein
MSGVVGVLKVNREDGGKVREGSGSGERAK